MGQTLQEDSNRDNPPPPCLLRDASACVLGLLEAEDAPLAVFVLLYACALEQRRCGSCGGRLHPPPAGRRGVGGGWRAGIVQREDRFRYLRYGNALTRL